MRLALASLLFVMPALAQLDSAALRAKFGPPMNREIFHLRPGFDLVVDYGANRQVCEMSMPPSTTREETERFLDELVPASLRGKSSGLNRTASSSEANQVYERGWELVIISIHINMGQDDGAWVRFTREDCKH